jgi:hypothetical protein
MKKISTYAGMTARQALMNDCFRGRGKTSQQMKEAPHGAVFVWCTGDLYYPKMLARHLGREDLKVKSFSWLQREEMYNLKPEIVVVVDHATRLNSYAIEALMRHEARRKQKSELESEK